MMRKRTTSSALLLTLVLVPVLLLGCSAEDVNLPTKPDLPGVDFPVAAAFACFVFANEPDFVSFEDRSTGAPTSWSWDFGDGRLSVEQHPKHQYAAPGVYVVTFTARDARTSSTVSALVDTSVPGASCG